MTKKMQSELAFWIGLYKKFTKKCKTPMERVAVEMDICWKITFPRYCKDLYVNKDSFKDKVVLDVGCGPHGGLIGFEDCEKFGIDPLIYEYKKIGYPIHLHKIYYSSYSIECTGFMPNMFDVITCVNTIDHVDDVDLAFSEMSRVLKPNGFILGQFMFHDIPDVAHPICLNQKKVKDLCDKNYLSIKDVRYQREGTGGKKESIYFYRIEKI